ncbi:MAG: hypothetical protein AAFR54_09180, partial [Planctomycetota bacterium]
AKALPTAWIDRVERAAADMARVAHPRELRPVHATMAEIVRAVRESLDVSERRRCHFVVDAPGLVLETDGRLLARALVRAAADRLERREDAELMVHAHADADSATFSLIDATPPSGDALAQVPAATLAETLLVRDAARLGGRAALHCAGDHRCAVVVLPLDPAAKAGGDEA